MKKFLVVLTILTGLFITSCMKQNSSSLNEEEILPQLPTNILLSDIVGKTTADSLEKMIIGSTRPPAPPLT